jgi:Fe-S oxidoreductase
MFSNQAKKIADACRFCWMCRYICPVGLVSCKEGNTPRGRALLLSLDSRGIGFTPDAYELMFQCALCNGCTYDCATGYEPPVFIREARTEAIVNDCVPDSVKPVLERAINGSISGEPVNDDLKREIINRKKNADVLLYLGDSAKTGGSASALALISILKKANVNFTILEDEPDSGAHLFDLMGYTADVQNTAKECINKIRETGAKSIVSIDPTYARFFKHQCNEWGLMNDLNAVTATMFVSDLVKDGKLEIEKLNITATFHDPCRLSRDLEETQPVRDIMEAMGVTIKEMFLNRGLTKCCGGAVLRESYPDLAGKMVKTRWEEAERTDTDLLVTACPCCAENFSAHIPDNMKTADIFVLLDKACK